MRERHLLPCAQFQCDRVPCVGILPVGCLGQLYAVHGGVVLQHDRSHGQDCVHCRLVLQCIWPLGRGWRLREWHLLPGRELECNRLPRSSVLCDQRHGQLYAVHAGVVLQHDGFVGRVGRMFGRILLSGGLVVGHADNVRERHLLPCAQFQCDRVPCVGILPVDGLGQLYAVHGGVVLQRDRSVGRVGRMFGWLLLPGRLE